MHPILDDILQMGSIHIIRGEDMTNRLAGSPADVKRMEEMLTKAGPPTFRKAFSDRTAWHMACLSELAYLKFNPLMGDDNLISRLSGLIDDGRMQSLLLLIEEFGYDHDKEAMDLKQSLQFMGLNLCKTFDEDGTQAFIASNKEYAVLSFRGTEPASIKDIKADANAKLVDCESCGKIHEGFDNAFKSVAQDIQAELNNGKYTDLPLYITGHSLGGALATIAAKKLTHIAGIAACYTFGSPRVGNEEWVSDIKTPIYRLVNAADPVTLLPPGDEFITPISWVIGFLPSVGEKLSSWLSTKFGGYLHCGNMRYMTNCKKGVYVDVKLLYSVSLLYRIKGWFAHQRQATKIPSDHSIAIYRKKLFVVAEKRNTHDE